MPANVTSSSSQTSQPVGWLTSILGCLLLGATLVGLMLLGQFLCQEVTSEFAAMSPRELVSSLAGTH